MVRVYTRTGDDGTTHCFKSGRISKDDQLIEAIGSVDELNSLLGLLIAQLRTESELLNENEMDQLSQIQSRLFDVGGALATFAAEMQFAELLEKIEEVSLEKQIDHMEKSLTEIRQFILPGGSLAASQAHVCRSFCRRTERNVVAVYHQLSDEPERVGEGILKLMKYLNRLSDFFFVLARYLNHSASEPEIFWSADGP